MRDVSGMERDSKFEKRIGTFARMYEEIHYCLFDMTARRLRAVRHNRSVPALEAARKAARGVRLGDMAFRFCEPGLCATSTFPNISQNVAEVKCVTRR
jgi:hypothetical protein